MSWKALIVCTLFFVSAIPARAAEPVTYKEIAMLLRNGEDQQYIINEAAKRKMLQPLTKDQEADLVSLGATPALMNALRAPASALSPQGAADYAARIQQQKQAALQQEQQDRQLLAEQAAASAPPPVAGNALAGKPLNLKFTAADGSAVDITKLRGKVVLVDFWATWCHPCMGEVPNVVAAYKKYHNQGFEIIGISLDKDKETMLKVTAEQGMTWPQYFDGRVWENEIATSFGIRSIPTMWLIDKNGVLAFPNARADLDGSIAKLLAQ